MQIRSGKHNFRIVKEKRQFVGYYSDQRSVTGPEQEMVLRALVKKHIAQLPEAIVLRFPSGERISSELID